MYHHHLSRTVAGSKQRRNSYWLETSVRAPPLSRTATGSKQRRSSYWVPLLARNQCQIHRHGFEERRELRCVAALFVGARYAGFEHFPASDSTKSATVARKRTMYAW
ncbi:MAG: hypothetical protein ACM3ZE_07090, partial [Myxococcales bacterium]